MEFFDCNTFFGLPIKRPLLPVATVDDLLRDMDKAGIGKALVWHILQYDYSPAAGNRILAESISGHDRLLGCWTLLPNQAHELPEPDEFFKEMKRSRIYALRVFPKSHKFLFNSVSMGDILERMVEKKVPLLPSLIRGIDWQEIYDVLSDFPDLVCIICDHGCWGMDRLFRPLIEHYPNVYIDTAQYLLDGGIESFVEDYGYERLLFGSGFPERYHGGLMLQIAHSDISKEAREAIAGGNLERIISEVEL